MGFLCTTIARDGDDHDVTIEFTATCVNPGYRATYMQPGEGPEFECLFESAEFEGRFAPDGKLTEAELATLRTWFAANHEKACEAANDNRADWS